MQGQRHFFPTGKGAEAPQQIAAVQGPRVPDFRGKSVRDVMRESTAAGLKVEVIGSGLAMAQDPPPGSVLDPRASVRVQFGR